LCVSEILAHFCGMLQKLKQRWKVNTLNMVLILCTFAIGGSLCGKSGAVVMQWTGLDKGVLWWFIYIIVVTLLWPLHVLLVSIPLGQFGFFRRYLQKMWQRMAGKKQKTVHLAIFASGAGSNAHAIIQYFANSLAVKIVLVVCNKPGAGVLQIAANAGIPTLLIDKQRFVNGDCYLPVLQQYGADALVLAGFLWKIPPAMVQAFPDKIVNIHPALLPRHGGKGMYGSFVHEAVIVAKETESGITIHIADEHYDHGRHLLQAKCEVLPSDTPGTLAQKIHLLEHQHYPKTIETWINGWQKG
jgi:formyltetrahydrofolate-dependent phosphoribosylglycinamide formyltransferase